jgi:hypothetical protein
MHEWRSKLKGGRVFSRENTSASYSTLRTIFVKRIVVDDSSYYELTVISAFRHIHFATAQTQTLRRGCTHGRADEHATQRTIVQVQQDRKRLPLNSSDSHWIPSSPPMLSERLAVPPSPPSSPRMADMPQLEKLLQAQEARQAFQEMQQTQRFHVPGHQQAALMREQQLHAQQQQNHTPMIQKSVGYYPVAFQHSSTGAARVIPLFESPAAKASRFSSTKMVDYATYMQEYKASMPGDKRDSSFKNHPWQPSVFSSPPTIDSSSSNSTPRASDSTTETPWRTIEEAMSLARGPLSKSTVHGTPPATTLPNAARIATELKVEGAAQARTLVTQHERWRALVSNDLQPPDTYASSAMYESGSTEPVHTYADEAHDDDEIEIEDLYDPSPNPPLLRHSNGELLPPRDLSNIFDYNPDMVDVAVKGGESASVTPMFDAYLDPPSPTLTDILDATQPESVMATHSSTPPHLRSSQVFRRQTLEDMDTTSRLSLARGGAQSSALVHYASNGIKKKQHWKHIITTEQTGISETRLLANALQLERKAIRDDQCLANAFRRS